MNFMLYGIKSTQKGEKNNIQGQFFYFLLKSFYKGCSSKYSLPVDNFTASSQCLTTVPYPRTLSSKPRITTLRRQFHRGLGCQPRHRMADHRHRQGHLIYYGKILTKISKNNTTDFSRNQTKGRNVNLNAGF